MLDDDNEADVLPVIDTDTLPELDGKGLFEPAVVNVGPTETVGEIAAVLVFDADVEPLTEGLLLTDPTELLDSTGVGLCVGGTDGENAGVFVFDAAAEPLVEITALTDGFGLLDSTGVALCVGPTDGEFEIALVDEGVFKALTDTLGDCDGSDEGDTEPDSDGAGDSDCFSDALPVDV